MACRAPLARTAGATGIDGDERTGGQVRGQLGSLDDLRREFVTQNKRLRRLGRTDSALEVVVQVAAAHPDRPHLEQHLVRGAFGFGRTLYSEVADAVQSGRRAWFGRVGFVLRL